MKKLCSLLALLVFVSISSFAQVPKPFANFVKGLKPVKLPKSVEWLRGKNYRLIPVNSDMSRLVLPAGADLKNINLERPDRAEFMDQLTKHGVVVREVNLPGQGISRVFTDNGVTWFSSPTALQAIDDGFHVTVFAENKGLGFSVDGTRPFFDFYDYFVMSGVQKLKNLGFTFQNSGNYFMVNFPQTPLSETPIFLSLEHKNPMALKNAPVGAFVKIRELLPFADGVPFPDLYVGRFAKAKPEGADWDTWTNHLAGYMDDAAFAYTSLEWLVERLGPYRYSVDIVWAGSWYVRDAQGRLYSSAEDFIAKGVVDDSSLFEAGF